MNRTYKYARPEFGESGWTGSKMLKSCRVLIGLALFTVGNKVSKLGQRVAAPFDLHGRTVYLVTGPWAYKDEGRRHGFIVLENDDCPIMVFSPRHFFRGLGFSVAGEYWHDGGSDVRILLNFMEDQSALVGRDEDGYKREPEVA